jgi:hypothetical protein
VRRSVHNRKGPGAALLLTLAALFAALAMAILAIFDGQGAFDRWRNPPAPLLEVEAIVPNGAPVQRVPQGAVLNPEGTLTVLRVPPTPAEPRLIVHGEMLPSATAPGPDLDPAIAGGIKAFFRTRPQPRDDRLITTTAEYKYTQLWLVLVDGCFRANRPKGPLVVFPPGARLFMDGGYLSAGVPGPPDMKARVGEELFWEAYAVRIRDPRSLERVHSICGPGAVLQAVPSSASVFAARQDSAAAMNFQRESVGVSWAEALRAVQECDRRMEASLRRDNARAPEIHVSNMCGSSLVNPPDPGNCPAGTRFERGNCLDYKGTAAPAAAPHTPPGPPPAPSR